MLSAIGKNDKDEGSSFQPPSRPWPLPQLSVWRSVEPATALPPSLELTHSSPFPRRSSPLSPASLSWNRAAAFLLLPARAMPQPELAPGARSLRVATWNVWFGESQSTGQSTASDWQRWAALLAEAIAGGAEVLCLQEVTQELHAALLMCQTIVDMYMPAEQISESEIPALFQGGYIVPQYISTFRSVFPPPR